MKINLSTRVKFGLIFLPAVLLSVALSLAFTLSCTKQLEYSSRVKILLVPLAIANIDNWFISILLFIALIGIIWPKGGPHPVLAFGASFFIIFPATFSIFVGVEIHHSSMRYTTMLKSNEMAIASSYQRLLTSDILCSLRDFFQEKFKCCGLKNSSYYCPNSSAFGMARPDDQHEGNMKKMLKLGKADYLAGEYNMRYSKLECPLDRRGTFPKSCCNGVCKSNCSSGDISNRYSKGCYDHIIEPLYPCLRVVPISYVFPWIALIYATIFSWAHLRKSQGVDVMEFGSIKKVSSMPLEDPEEFEKKDLSEVTKFAESLAGESNKLSPNENVSKTPSKVVTPGTVAKAPSKLLTPPGTVAKAPSKLLIPPGTATQAGRRNSKLSAKVPSYSKMK